MLLTFVPATILACPFHAGNTVLNEIVAAKAVVESDVIKARLAIITLHFCIFSQKRSPTINLYNAPDVLLS